MTQDARRSIATIQTWRDQAVSRVVETVYQRHPNLTQRFAEQFLGSRCPPRQSIKADAWAADALHALEQWQQ